MSHLNMSRIKEAIAVRDMKYPGGLTREQWLALTLNQRVVLAECAKSDLLALWRSCKTKRCRRAQRCMGNGKQCALRPFLPDLNNPNLGNPGFRFSFRLSRKMRMQWATLDSLPFNG
jgi:hypothetical protein